MLALRVAVGTLWGSMLFIAGLSIAARHASRFESPELIRMVGVGLAALGLYVFSAVVADRIFPRADPLICWGVQILLGSVVAAGLVCFIIAFIRFKFPGV
ncbi:MAG: hypothetical protein QM783_08545 [Phycisphaerales bacterium]